MRDLKFCDPAQKRVPKFCDPPPHRFFSPPPAIVNDVSLISSRDEYRTIKMIKWMIYHKDLSLVASSVQCSKGNGRSKLKEIGEPGCSQGLMGASKWVIKTRETSVYRP